ncbi:MAG: mechanosensitive ion channel family protein [Gemmatimonadaceae bacterium]|nr:mechanosensitive ion channel family protein [Gemmatimonadaceae bacterium]
MLVIVLQKKKSATQLELGRPRSTAEWRENGVDYALDKGIDVGGVLLSLVAAWLIIRLVARRIERWGDDGHDGLHSAREQRARTSARLVRSAGRALLTVVGLLMLLDQLDFNISPLLASAGVVGLAVSFGSQSLVRDFVTGFFLQLEHQFALGDVIRIGTVEGTVENITLRLVYLRDATGALHIIPNGQIAQVTNLTRSWGRVAVDSEIAWRDSDRALVAVQRAADSLGADPAWADALLDPPMVMGLEKLGTGTVTLRTVARVDPYRRDDVARDLRRRIKESLDAAGVVPLAAPPGPAVVPVAPFIA